MQTIHKYPLSIIGVQDVEMPETSEILSAQNQNGQLCVWARVETDSPIIKRRFRIFGTGHPYPVVDILNKYVGSVQMANGALVWHVYVDYVK